MPNPKPKTEHLPKQTTTWFHLPTKAIRVPEVFARRVQEYAQYLDRSAVSHNSIKKPTTTTWLGIRPSISKMGWAVLLDKNDFLPDLIDYGSIETDSDLPMGRRLAEIETDLLELFSNFFPDRIVIETPIVEASYPSARKLLECMGALQLIIYRHCHQSPLMLYRAQWKSNLVDRKADADEVKETVEDLFQLGNCDKVCAEAIGIAYAGVCGIGAG